MPQWMHFFALMSHWLQFEYVDCILDIAQLWFRKENIGLMVTIL